MIRIAKEDVLETIVTAEDPVKESEKEKQEAWETIENSGKEAIQNWGNGREVKYASSWKEVFQ